jgi:hypothetical protein
MGKAMREDPESIIGGQLSPEEEVLWTGRLRGGIRLRPADGFLIPFSLIWTGFPAFLIVMAVLGAREEPSLLIVAVIAIPFLLVGLYFVIGRFAVDARRREKTSYGLTNQRIVIVSGIFRRKVKSLNLRTLTDVSLTERRDGSGHISLGPTNPMFAWFGGTGGWWPGMEAFTPASFEMLDGARQVYEKIVEAQRYATAPVLPVRGN